jgi:hypothetical protein
VLKNSNYAPMICYSFSSPHDESTIQKLRQHGILVSKVPKTLTPFGKRGNIFDSYHFSLTCSKGFKTPHDFLLLADICDFPKARLLYEKSEGIRLTIKQTNHSSLALYKKLLSYFPPVS